MPRPPMGGMMPPPPPDGMKKPPKKKPQGLLSKNIDLLKMWFKFCPNLLWVVGFYLISLVVSSLVEVALIKDTVELLSNGESFEVIFKSVLKYVIILGISSLVKIFYEDYFEPRERLLYVKKIIRHFFLKVREIDMREYDNPDFYSHFSRAFRDCQFRAYHIYRNFLDLIKNVLLTISLGTYVVVTDAWLIIILVIPTIIYIWAVNKSNKLIYNWFVESETDMRYYWYVNRTFYQHEYAAELKTTPVSKLLIDKYEDSLNTIDKSKKKMYKKQFKYDLLKSFINIFVQNIGVYGYITYSLFKTGNVSTFSSLISAALKIKVSLVNLAYTYTNIVNDSMYIDDILWVLNYQPEIEKDEGLAPDKLETIEVKDITFRYQEDRRIILNHLNIKINKGERIAIVGLNGAGKTTLIKLLLKFYLPTSGDITYNGISYRDYNPKELRKRMSVIFQDYQIYAVSIAENVLMRRMVTKDDEIRVWDSLDKAGLIDKVKSLKDGIYTQMTREFDESGEAFSGGERQKLVIARVFANDADLYIFDEPTASLDPLAEKKINELIIHSSLDKTMIVIAHRLSSVVDADKIYLLKDGSFKEVGTNEELIKLNGDYAKMFNTQKHLYEKE